MKQLEACCSSVMRRHSGDCAGSPDAFRIANGVGIEHHSLPEDVLEHLRRPAWHEPSLGDISADFYRRTDPG